MLETEEKKLEVRVYSNDKESISFFSGVRETWQFRDLALALASRDIAIRYKQSVLGVAWAIFAPLMMMVIFSAAVSTGVINVNTGGIPYPIFVYCGLLPWTFFQACIGEGTPCLINNISLVTKVYFPREVFPVSVIISKFVDFLMSAVVLIILMIYYRFVPKWTMVFLPCVIFIQLILTTGLLMLFSMGNLFYRDVKKIVEVVVFLWMFASSVIYPIPLTGRIGSIVGFLNPMIPILDAYRSLILHGTINNIEYMIVAVLISMLMMIFGVSLFHKYEFLFAERI